MARIAKPRLQKTLVGNGSLRKLHWGPQHSCLLGAALAGWLDGAYLTDVSAVLRFKVNDYYHNGARRRLRLHEKGGKEHEMPVHHLLELILNEYIEVAGLQSGQPLFQSLNSLGTAVTIQRTKLR